MAAQIQELLIKYRSDVSELQSRVASVETSMRKVDAAAAASGKNIKEGFDKGSQGAKDLNEKINPLGSAFETIGKTIVAAFAVERVVAFGLESVKAFQESEKNARLLQVAVGVNGGLTRDFDNLVSQSKKLQEESIFSDDDIQKAQTFALQFGLTADEVQKLIPIVADYASATGKDLNSALEAVIQGINGQGRELKKSGIIVDSESTRTERFADIQDKLNAKFSDQAKVVASTSEGALKQYENKLDDIQEEIGAKVAPKLQLLRGLFLSVAEGSNASLDLLDNFFQNLAEFTRTDEENAKIAAGKIPLITLNAVEANRKAVEGFKKDFSSLSLDELEKKSLQTLDLIAVKKKDIAGLSAKEAQTGSQLLAEYSSQFVAINSLIKEKERGLSSDQKAFDIGTATLKQLEERKKLLSTQSGLAAQDESDKIDAEIKKRKDAAKKAAEDAARDRKQHLDNLHQLEEKASEDNVKAKAGEVSKVTQLEAEKQIAIAKLRDEFTKAGLTDKNVIELKKLQDAIEQTGNAFDILKAKEQQALDVKNIESDLSDTLKVLENARIEAVNAAQETFLASGNKSPEALKALQDKIQSINESYKKAQVNETVKFNNTLVELNKNDDQKLLDAKIALNQAIQQGNQQQIDSAQKVYDAERLISEKRIDLEGQLTDVKLSLLETGSSAISEIISRGFEDQLEQQQAFGDAEIERIDAEIQANADAEENKQISARKSQEVNKKLLADRKAQEEKNATELAAIKTKAFNFEKIAKSLEVLISLAEGIAKIQVAAAVLAANPLTAALAPLALAQIPIVSTAAGIQLALILSQKAPKFARGTKASPHGLAMVGEEGPELTFLPGKSKVLSSGKTKKYSEIIDAMYDDRFENYIWKVYVNPELEKKTLQLRQSIAIPQITFPSLTPSRNLYEQKKQESFAQNIANSFILHNDAIDEYGMKRVIDKTNPRLAELIGVEVAKVFEKQEKSAYH